MEDIQSIVRNDLHKININIDTEEKLEFPLIRRPVHRPTAACSQI